jgi:hypothetical protein
VEKDEENEEGRRGRGWRCSSRGKRFSQRGGGEMGRVDFWDSEVEDDEYGDENWDSNRGPKPPPRARNEKRGRGAVTGTQVWDAVSEALGDAEVGLPSSIAGSEAPSINACIAFVATWQS